MATATQCTTYTKRIATLVFGGDVVCCDRCPCCETYARKQCRLTGCYIMDGRTVNCFCPLVNPDTGEVEGNYANNYNN